MRRHLLAAATSLTAVSLLIAGCGSTNDTTRSAAAAESSQANPGDAPEPVPVLTEVEPSPTLSSGVSRRELGSSQSLPDMALVGEGNVPVSVSESAEVTTPAEVGASPGATESAEPDEAEQAAADELTGVRLCLKNSSSRTVTIASGFGEPNPRDLAPGEEQCNQNSNPFGKDVMGQLAVGGVTTMAIAVNNPLIGLSTVIMSQPESGPCVDDKLGRQGMKSTTDDGLLNYQVERVTPFSVGVQQIEFQLVLSDSNNPSSGSRARKCS